MRRNEQEQEQVWSIGIYVGQSPFNFLSLENINNPVLTRDHVSDVRADFLADPFMIPVNNTWYMFFEVLNRQTAKGEIGLALSENGLDWAYNQIVLSEPFHLSYPYVFKYEHEYFMLPESHQANSVRLYKALSFPTQWVFIKTLLEGRGYVDPSIFYFDNKWWLLVGDGAAPSRADTLRLYYANELTGPWSEHPKSPIIEGNSRIARPAGRPLLCRGKMVRYAQDCFPSYGTQVRAFEISHLSTRSYFEKEIEDSPILTPSGTGWNKWGMHHLDPHLMADGRWLACVDGRGSSN